MQMHFKDLEVGTSDQYSTVVTCKFLQLFITGAVSAKIGYWGPLANKLQLRRFDESHLPSNRVIRHLEAAVIDDLDIESGPTLSAKKRQIVQQFVDKMGGKRVIQRILIANNGMAATKAILSMRQWAYTVLGKCFISFLL